MRINRLWAAVLGSALGLALVTGCSGEQGSGAGGNDDATTRGTGEPTHASTTDLLRGRVLPSYAYDERGEKGMTIRRAAFILQNDCLAGFGFDPIPESDSVPPEPPMYRRYGVTDPVVAAEYGHHLDAIGQANTPDLDAPPPAWLADGSLRLVLHGGGAGAAGPGRAEDSREPERRTYDGKPIPAGGCAGEANRTLGQADLTDEQLQLAGEISSESFFRAETDPRVVAVTKRWSGCMAEKGHHVRDPYDDDFDIEGPITAAERRHAEDDVACKEETGLVDVWFDVESEFQQVLIQENLEALAEVQAAIDAKVAKALDVIATAGEK